MRAKVWIAAITWCTILLTGCTATISENQENGNSSTSVGDSSGFWVRWKGDRGEMMRMGDLSAKIDLDSLADIPNLYALGPVEGLRGEISVYDGLVSVSTLANGSPEVDTLPRHNAAFLVYGSASRWKDIRIEEHLAGLDAVEQFVSRTAQSLGISLNQPFPFRFEGIADTLVYHIIYKTDATPHTHKEHQKAKHKFCLTDTAVRVIGFHANAEGEGIYTHPGKRTHLHFQLSDNSTSGHIDHLVLRPGTVLYLPH